MKNECVDAAVSELDALGVASRIEYGGKHIHVCWEHDGEPRKYTTGATPSDRRAHLNVRSDMRRILREDGLIVSDDAVPVELPRPIMKSGEPVVSSLDIARHFSKQHKDVLRAIDRVIEETGQEFAERNFTLSEYIDPSGRALRQFDLSRDGFSFLVMGFTGPAAVKWKLAYLEAFNAMETQLRGLGPGASLAVAKRVEKLEGDLKALIDLCMDKPATPGFIYIKAHRRRVRGCA